MLINQDQIDANQIHWDFNSNVKMETDDLNSEMEPSKNEWLMPNAEDECSTAMDTSENEKWNTKFDDDQTELTAEQKSR